ncbi:MAG: V4R domain-containing protein [Candidatus Micrarchaeaceae archaeon]
MQRKAVEKRRPTRRSTKARSPRRASAARAPVSASGYDDALLKAVVNRHSKQSVSSHALELSGLLSSLTPAMRTAQHKSGFRIGRALYRIYEPTKRYIWYEESISDLVSFLESAGLGSVAYNVFPDTVSIRIYNRHAPGIGIPTHDFEAGIISGFVSAGRHQHTEINETRCSRSGHEQCEFTRSSRQTTADVSEEWSISRLISGAVSAVHDGRQAPTVPSEYYMLVSSTLFRHEYSHVLRNIATYLGNEFASALHLTGTRPSLDRAEHLTRLLNLGSLRIKGLKPVDVEIEFDGLSSRMEHVELSLAFLDGLLNRLISDKAKMETLGARSAHGYRVRLKEKK